MNPFLPSSDSNKNDINKNLIGFLLRGVTNEINKKNSESYFKREYDKWLNRNYSINEFFDYCKLAVDKIEEYQKLAAIDKDLLQERINHSGFPLPPLPPLDKDKEHIIQLQNCLDRDDLRLINELDNISLRNYLEDVLSKTVEKNKTKNKDITPLDFNLNQKELIYVLELLIQAKFIDPSSQSGSYANKLETFFSAHGKPLKNPHQTNNKNTGQPPARKEYLKKSLMEAIRLAP